MWSYLKDVGLLLEGLTMALKGLPSGKMVEAKHLLTTQSLENTKKPITISQKISFVTNEKKEIAPGLLLYVTEGVLPMLKVEIKITKCVHKFNPLLISYSDFLFNIFSAL